MGVFKPKIGWTKWQNPYAIEENNEEDKNTYAESEQKKAVRVIMTPMGMIPAPEHSDPQKVFDLWTAHTNFDITANILNLVENTAGVETVDVYTRYRMRVGIGKMFDAEDTIKNINQNLCSFISPPTTGNLI